PPQAQTPQDAGLADLADIPPPDLITTVTPADVHVDELLPVIQAPRLPVQQSVLVLASPLLEPGFRPVVDVVQPEPAAVEPILSRVAAADLAPPPPPADPAEVTGGIITTPPAPVARSSEAAQAAPTLPRTAAPDPAGDRLASSSVGAGEPAQPVPESPPGTATAPCPASSTGSNATTKSAHTVTLNDGCPEANLALLPHRMYWRAAGLPGSPNQRPSTSPD
ncbi:MAG: hypothetical protein ABR608_07760, partial [Pseudonocardiaceae bacterium]